MRLEKNVIVSLLVVFMGLTLLAPAQKGVAGFEDLLLQAELLEVSAGDLKEAMAVYESLAADPAAPKAVVARALLYQGRCHRKLGQLARARTVLEELIQQHPDQRDVVRQARSFLRELQTGQADEPAFDWLGEMETNPEIQARVFDLAMDLTDKDRAVSAQRQLLALGPLAYPVLERLIETSRDHTHRHYLTLILLRQGRYDLLPELFRAPTGYRWSYFLRERDSFLASLYDLEPEEQGRFRDVLAGIPSDPDPHHLHLSLRLWAGGGLTALRQDLRRLKHVWNKERLLAQLRRSDPSAPGFFADQILDENLDLEVRYTLMRSFEGVLDPPLGPAHYAGMIRAVSTSDVLGWSVSYRDRWIESTFNALLARGALEEILAVIPDLPIPVGEVIKYKFTRVRKELYDNDWSRIPSGWVPVLGASGNWPSLFMFAERSDAAVPALSDFLARGAFDPGEHGYDAGNYREPFWKPSAAHQQAMRGALSIPYAFTRAYALEVLSLRPDAVDEALLDQVLEIAGNDEDGHVREFALFALVCWSPRFPERQEDIVRALVAEFDRRRATGDVPDSFQDSSARVRWLGSVERRHLLRMKRSVVGTSSKPIPGTIRPVSEDEYRSGLRWIYYHPAAASGSISLAAPILSIAERQGATAFYEEYATDLIRVRNTPEELRRSWLDSLESLTNPELVTWLALNMNFPSEEESNDERLIDFHRRIVTDPTFDMGLREKVYRMRGNKTSWDWFDWPELLRTGDPLGKFALDLVPLKAGPGGRFNRYREYWEWVGDLEEDQRSEILRAALVCPLAVLRHQAADFAPFDHQELMLALSNEDTDVRGRIASRLPLDHEESEALFRKALANEDSSVRLKAAKRLRESQRADLRPLYYDRLSDSFAAVRLEALAELGRDADAASIEYLVPLLDDPDIRVRERAIEVLRKTRQDLEEKGEWRRLVEGQ